MAGRLVPTAVVASLASFVSVLACETFAPHSRGLVWVMKRHAGSDDGTAEAPPIPDGIAAVPRTGSQCHKQSYQSDRSLHGGGNNWSHR